MKPFIAKCAAKAHQHWLEIVFDKDGAVLDIVGRGTLGGIGLTDLDLKRLVKYLTRALKKKAGVK